MAFDGEVLDVAVIHKRKCPRGALVEERLFLEVFSDVSGTYIGNGTSLQRFYPDVHKNQGLPCSLQQIPSEGVKVSSFFGSGSQIALWFTKSGDGAWDCVIRLHPGWKYSFTDFGKTIVVRKKEVRLVAL